MISAASDQRAYDAYCEATAPDACPICGIDCRCDGPHESIAAAIVAAAERVGMLPRRIPADPRLAAIADQIAESILATLAAHGYAIVREADTQGYSAERQRDFAREAARNAVGIAAMEGVL